MSSDPGRVAPCSRWTDWAFVALGSNLGDSVGQVLRAMGRLEAFSLCPPLKSSLYLSSPVDCPPGSPPFINAVVGLRPGPEETPESLLAKLQALEREFGRGVKQGVNQPRVLDLDLIAYGPRTRDSARLVLPHARASRRRFVLAPLGEIAPDLVLPGLSQTVAELLAGLPAGEVVKRLDGPVNCA